mgnify:CR=1 FL=1
MTYQELVSKLKDTYQEKMLPKSANILPSNLTYREKPKVPMYLEIANGQLHVEPYEYYDRDILVTTSAADLLALAQGSLDILEAYQSGKISAEGNLAKALLLNEIVTGSSEAPAPAESALVEAPSPAESALVEAPSPAESATVETPAGENTPAAKPSVKAPRMSRKKNRKRHK